MGESERGIINPMSTINSLGWWQERSLLVVPKNRGFRSPLDPQDSRHCLVVMCEHWQSRASQRLVGFPPIPSLRDHRDTKQSLNTQSVQDALELVRTGSSFSSWGNSRQLAFGVMSNFPQISFDGFGQCQQQYPETKKRNRRCYIRRNGRQLLPVSLT